MKAKPLITQDHLNRSKNLLHAGKIDEAYQEFNKNIAKDLQLPPILWDFAYQEYNKANAKDRDLVWGFLLNFQGKKYFLEGFYDYAIEYFTAALRITPDNASTLHNRGVAYLDRGIRDRGIPNKAIIDYAVYFEGDAHDERTDFDRAIEDFSAALGLSPEDTDTLSIRGFTYQLMGNYEKAIVDYDALIQIRPDDLKTLCALGAVYYCKGDYDRAIEYTTTAFEVNPNDCFPLYLRGIAYAKTGDLTQAIADFTAALLIKPDFTGALFSRAYSYFFNDNYEKAMEDLKAILRLEPNYDNGKLKKLFSCRSRKKQKILFGLAFHARPI
jgi:tetratricopeptide (TPR) repeat protein